MKTAKSNKIFRHIFFFLQVTAAVLIPIASFFLLEEFTHHAWEMEWGRLILSFIFFYLFYLLMFFLIGRMHWAFIISNTLIMIVGLSNYYVLQFRGSPILPWDLGSLRTASSVADNFTFTIDVHTGVVIFLFLVLTVISFFIRFHLSDLVKQSSDKHKTLKLLGLRSGGTILCILALFFYISGLQTQAVADLFNIYEMPFTQGYTYKQNGFFVSFLVNTKYLKVDEPQDYSAKAANEILADTESAVPVSTSDDSSSIWDPNSYEALYNNNDSDTSGNKGSDVQADPDSPNLIVIMNEAFSDYQMIADFDTSEDYMPFIHSLMEEKSENTVSGRLYTSVLGGNTANTEFEFLTCDTMAFLPSGSIPYQQYVKDYMPSLAWDLKGQGYTTIAMHPYYASGWNRNDVYEYLGFDKQLFKSDFASKDYIRNYISDAAAFHQLILEYEENKDDGPVFEFLVTMQNHGGYSKEFENFVPDITVSGHENWNKISSYLSLIKKTDEAFAELVEYFSSQEENTIILMFGDHQPAHVESAFLRELYGKNVDELDLEELSTRYMVPFVLWANYDIEEQSGQVLSANYLSTLLLETAGLDMNEYQTYVSEQKNTLPVITANFFMDNQRTVYSYQEDTPYDELLNDYSILQYNHLFDEDNRLKEVYMSQSSE